MTSKQDRENAAEMLRRGVGVHEVAECLGISVRSVNGIRGNMIRWGNQNIDKQADMVNKPPHYIRGGIEVIDAIEAWALGYHLGNVVKYVARAGHKGDRLEDLRKAQWYLGREIEQEERRLQSGGESGHTDGQGAKP